MTPAVFPPAPAPRQDGSDPPAGFTGQRRPAFTRACRQRAPGLRVSFSAVWAASSHCKDQMQFITKTLSAKSVCQPGGLGQKYTATPEGRCEHDLKCSTQIVCALDWGSQADSECLDRQLQRCIAPCAHHFKLSDRFLRYVLNRDCRPWGGPRLWQKLSGITRLGHID